MTASAPFDFSRSMSLLCEDICERLIPFQHVEMQRVAVSFAQARQRALHGLQAKLTPLRFEGGRLTVTRGGRTWTIQRLFRQNREMLYILTFYLPRFFDHPLREKLTTILHELYHISPEFNGDIRRHAGRYHVHTHSQREYDASMAQLADLYLRLRPPPSVYEFLRHDFASLKARHGHVVGLRIPIPKLTPVAKSA